MLPCQLRPNARASFAALGVREARRVHAMLDGVFEGRNHFFNIRRQYNPTLDNGPHRDRRGLHEVTAQPNGLEIVVKIRSPAAMQRIACLPDTWATVFPVARAANVSATFVGQKHVSTAIESLSVPLQAPRTPGERCKVGFISHDNQNIYVLGVGFDGQDRAQNRDAPDAGKLAGRCHESVESVEQQLPLTPLLDVHRRHLNRERKSRRAAEHSLPSSTIHMRDDSIRSSRFSLANRNR